MITQKVFLVILLAYLHESEAQNYFCNAPITAASNYIALNGGLTGNTIVSRGPGASDDLVHLDSSEQLVSRTTSQSLLTTFPNPNGNAIIDSTFCSGGKMYSARISTDTFDDLLCHESNGEFSYKVYHPTADSYGIKIILPSVSGWSCAVGSKLIIGNFDGKGTDEIICLGSAAINFNGALLYSPPDCLQTDRFKPQTRRTYYRAHHTHHYGRGKRHAKRNPNGCKIGKLFVLGATNLPNCNPSTDSVIVGKVNSRSMEGLICHKNSDNSVSYYAGGLLSTLLFSSEATTAAGVTCDRSNNEMILAADINGDQYSDFVCVSTMPDPYKLEVSIQDSNGGFSALAATACSASPNPCYESGNTAKPISWDVGSFNGDAKEDLFCRFEDVSGTDDVLHITTA